MSFRSNIIKKPWGYEYLIYENNEVGVWVLNIKHSQRTSLHCHPQKTTGLVILDGECELQFLADKRQISALDKAMIRRGLFHSTKALSQNGAIVLEIETPKDKLDLVRLNDLYGREAEPYENSSHEASKNENCLWLEEPSEKANEYLFANCSLKVQKINDIHSIIEIPDDILIVFLRGGMFREASGKKCVTIPGDVGFARIVKQVAKQLDGVVKDTLILTISK